MEKVRTNYEDYWKEFEELHKETKNLDDYLEEDCAEGEQEVCWLRDAGFEDLLEPFQQGREIDDSELNASINYLSKQQGAAVKKRVRSLNQTIRNRYGQQRGHHQRKPDIRDVFRNVETSSTGTRSRSATPDSLDFIDDTPDDVDDEWSKCSPPQRTLAPPPPPEPASTQIQNVAPVTKHEIRSSHDLFRKSGHWRVDVASDSEGIELLGYQRIGTIHGARGFNRNNGNVTAAAAFALSASDLINLDENRLKCDQTNRNELSRSHSNLYQSSFETSGPTSFENFCQETGGVVTYMPDSVETDVVEIDTISDSDFSHLKSLLWLEVSAIFDRYSVEFHKKKIYKRIRKENGNLFGVNLSTLVMRDRRICSDNSTVPHIFTVILDHLETQGSKEEGVLRVAGHKQKVEALCMELEAHFYTKPNEMKLLLQKSTCHELVAVLKKLLRDLPQPILTTELVGLFYKIHALPTVESQRKVMNLLVLLLPVEHSGTLKALMSFFSVIIRNEKYNKMSLHNVAMIVAPSIFPPKYVQSFEKDDLNGHVKMAAVCCRLVELMLQCGLNLWKIPIELWQQLQLKIQNIALQKLNLGSKHAIRKKKEPLRRSNTQYSPSTRMYSGYPVVRLA